MSVRVRFAPSPTGFLHLGGLRTALFNYLLARQSPDGKFLLRIEDTDQTRYVPGAVEQIGRALTWAGIPYDEGPDRDGGRGPYYQSQRLATYKEHVHRLLHTGHAYPCFCSQGDLESSRSAAESQHQAHNYDRRCLGLPKAEVQARVHAGEVHTIRLLVPHGGTTVNDLIYGRVQFSNRLIDDQILLKSDGFPTYHLANVVDDHLMGITHVIRGEEWLSSTPKHLMLYKAFGWAPPQFAHLPLLLDENKAKLSKRNKHANVNSYMEEYLPAALLNFVAFLGWAPDNKREIFSLEELVKEFSIKRVNKSGAVVLQQKLDWFNREHIILQSQKPEGMADLVSRTLRIFENTNQAEPNKHAWLSLDSDHSKWRWRDNDYLSSVIDGCKDRLHVLRDLTTRFYYLFERIDWQTDDAKALHAKLNVDHLAPLGRNAGLIVHTLVDPSDPLVWAKDTTSEALHHAIADAAKQASIASSPAMMAARYMLSASAIGPSLGKIMLMLGPSETLSRLGHFAK